MLPLNDALEKDATTIRQQIIEREQLLERTNDFAYQNDLRKEISKLKTQLNRILFGGKTKHNYWIAPALQC